LPTSGHVSGFLEWSPHPDPVQDLESGQIAGENADERHGRIFHHRPSPLEAASIALELDEGLSGGKEVPLPRLGASHKPEVLSVVTLAKAVESWSLLVGPSNGQIFRTVEFLKAHGTVSNGGAHESVTLLFQSVQQDREIGSTQA